MPIVKRLYCCMCNLSIPLFAQVPGLWTIRRLPQANFHDTDGVASVDARIYSYAWYLVSVDGRARTARRTRCKIHHTSTYSFNTFIHQSIKYFILSVHSGNMWKLLQVQLAEPSFSRHQTPSMFSDMKALFMKGGCCDVFFFLFGGRIGCDW